MTVYNGTITIGVYSSGGSIFYGSYSAFPFGSVSIDVGGPTFDPFYWGTDDGGSTYTVVIVAAGNVPGAVTWNGAAYDLVYDVGSDVSSVIASAFSPPISGTSSFSYDSAPASSTYTLALETKDINLAPQVVGMLSNYITVLGVYDAAVSFPPISLVDGAASVIALETCDISVTGTDVGLSAGYSILIQGKLISPIFEDMGLLSSANEISIEAFDVRILVNGMVLLRGGAITMDTFDVSASFPEVFLTTGAAPARPSRSFGVIFS